ncbi:MAG: EamA family transporter RarD [Gammaproteobacteria bacterium]|jgi:chloramphenicol-sensitive protein RarD|nr:EamA family transporter RarD [Gammaproteobacteria bacterium]MBU2238205.1 EamA family transporter RarD [Gammaproteobacteria bacterium]MBU2319701.1 EamA family transporter RarD [Gammaproteobacteria bacterium]|tara:strand:+ start:24140 stop:25054 length:915 start_codon:yes stop_codon:yes gene_type:complete
MQTSSKSGILYALTAFTLWAIAPIYFKEMSFIPAQEILAHRIIWSCLIVLVLIILLRYTSALKTVLRSPKTLSAMLISTVLIGFNWGIFIWAIQNNKILSASLGYYINPLISILLGVIFFKDKLDRVRKAAVVLCFCAVAFEVIQFGSLPWIALALAITFGFYGLVRKKVAVDSFTGMAIETAILLPFALAYLILSDSPSTNMFDNSSTVNWLLLASGPITMVPLMCFAAAANRVSLVTLGFFQYIGPTGMFILAVFLYDEPLSPEKLTTFVLIWSALAMLIVDSIRRLRKTKVAKLIDSDDAI